MNVVGYKDFRSSLAHFSCNGFYMNVVGYKDSSFFHPAFTLSMFYMNVVGYKVGLSHDGSDKVVVLYERSGI